MSDALVSLLEFSVTPIAPASIIGESEAWSLSVPAPRLFLRPQETECCVCNGEELLNGR